MSSDEAPVHSVHPAAHYDRVTDAWGLLLGEELHYGVFTTDHDPLPVATAALTQRMVDAARLRPGLTVLDVGCGTGAPACALATEHGVHVTGITTSAVGVAAATARAASAGVRDQVDFEVRDGTANGFPDGSFDRVWVLESSHLMRDRAALISECARVLRPGGRLALCDIILRRAMPFEEVKRLRKPLAVLRDAFGDARMEPLDLYASMATDHGLVVDQQDDLTAVTRSTFDRWRANADAHRSTVISLIGEDGWQQFVESCEILEGFWDDGTLGYGLLAASKPGA